MIADIHLSIHALDVLLEEGIHKKDIIDVIVKKSYGLDKYKGAVLFTRANRKSMEKWIDERRKTLKPGSRNTIKLKQINKLMLTRPNVSFATDSASECEAIPSFHRSDESLPACLFLTGSKSDASGKLCLVHSEELPKECVNLIEHCQEPHTVSSDDILKLGCYFNQLIFWHPYLLTSGITNSKKIFCNTLIKLFQEHPFADQKDHLPNVRRLDIHTIRDDNDQEATDRFIKKLFERKEIGYLINELLVENINIKTPTINEVRFFIHKKNDNNILERLIFAGKISKPHNERPDIHLCMNLAHIEGESNTKPAVGLRHSDKTSDYYYDPIHENVPCTDRVVLKIKDGEVQREETVDEDF